MYIQTKWRIGFLSPFTEFQKPLSLTVVKPCGLLFQESSSPGVPYCYFVDDLYSVSNIQYDSNGASADISLKSSPDTNAFPSTPVNPLRLQVTYHKNEMLQFKVSTEWASVLLLFKITGP